MLYNRLLQDAEVSKHSSVRPGNNAHVQARRWVSVALVEPSQPMEVLKVNMSPGPMKVSIRARSVLK